MKHLQIPTLIVVICLFPQRSYTDWQRFYVTDYEEVGYTVEQTTDGGYIIMATRANEIFENQRDFWLIKTGPVGETLWTRTCGMSDWSNDYGMCARQTSDGGYIMTGRVGSLETQSYDLWLLKTDENGDTLWTRKWGREGKDWGFFVDETYDGGYVVIGSIDGEGFDSGDLWVIKTNSDGDSIWSHEYGNPGVSDRGFCIFQTRDSCYIATGFTSSFGKNEADELCGLWLLKLDSNGDTLWTKVYRGERHSGAMYSGFCVRELSQGGYVVAGTHSLGEDEAWLLRMDSQGDTLWTKFIAKGDWTYLRSVAETPDGGFILVGQNTYFPDSPALLVLKTDSQGDSLWTRRYFHGGAEANWVEVTDDGGYIIVGESGKTNDYFRDVLLIKIDSETEVVEDQYVSEPIRFEVTSLGSKIVLRYNDFPSGFHANIYDSTGRLVDVIESVSTSGQVTWGDGFSPGVYFIQPTSISSRTYKVVLIR